MKTPDPGNRPAETPTSASRTQITPSGGCGPSCSHALSGLTSAGVSRRHFLQGVSVAGVAFSALGLTAAKAATESTSAVSTGEAFPRGKPLRLKPLLVYDVPSRQEQTSWRGYGAIQTPAAAQEEAVRIGKELDQIKAQADFPIEIEPVVVLEGQARLKQAPVTNMDACIVYAAGACTEWPLSLPMIMFVRHRSGPFYLGFEIAHWRFLRQSGDMLSVKEFTPEDVVVDSTDELLWRLRALYGLKNARGTKMLTVGGLEAYSSLAQENGPRVAKEIWGYEFVNVSNEEFAKRLQAARADAAAVREAEERTVALLGLPNVQLQTDRKFVVNSQLTLHVLRQLLRESGASNFGFARCMGREQISMLGTPPCLVLSLANDEGWTAFCHTDLSHTMPGVLMRWIASRPAFVCNSHYPHDGLFFVAHCQAPRRMNGRDFEPATIMTHYESDYGAACKTHYTQDQVVTAVVPNLACTKWFGFRGKIVGAPSYPACRSQMEILVDGDWKRLAREMEGFHTQVVYGDYTREIGYALRKVGGQIAWRCYSDA